MKKYYILLILACIVLNVEAKKPIEKQKNKPLNEKINLKPASWFSDIIESITSLWQPVWGKYTEGGSTNKSYPLACADRKTEITDLREMLKEKIKPGQYFDSTIWNIYFKIFDNATNNPIISCGDNGTCASASIIKDAAFVYWLGINKTGDTLSAGARQSYLDKVKSGMWSWADNKAGSFKTKEYQIYRAKENIMLMQAYNFLEMAKQENAALLTDNVRNDLREEIFEFTYQLYSNANNPISGFKLGALTDIVSNNMTLIVASAVGMGAIILSDRETYWWANQRKPDRWANAAHAYIKSTMFEGDNSLADASIGDGGSFAEGPYYFKFSYEAMLPFFQSFKNFTNGSDRDYGPYYKCTLCWGQYKISNYYANSNYLGLADWYNNIKMPNGDAPTIDDSWSTSNNFGGLALTGEPRHSIVSDPTDILTSPHMNLMADYLARYNYYEDGNSRIQDSYKSYNGDIVVRSNKDSLLQSRHYIHLNVERNKAINGGEPTIFSLGGESFTFGHEHADIGNIIITAGEDVLAIDPAYYGDKNFDNYNVNKGKHHNLITINGAGPDWDDEAEWADLQKTNNEYKMSYKGNYWNYNAGIRTSKRAIVTRDIRVCRVNESLPPYYEIDDYITNRNWWDSEHVRFNLNGNGNQNEGSFRLLDNNTGVWDYPCIKDSNSSDNWKMQATITTLIDQDTIEKDAIVENGFIHGNFNTTFNPTIAGNFFRTTSDRNITRNIGSGNSKGEHTRLVKELTIEPDEKAHFHTTIRVFKCTDKDTLIPQIQRSGKYTSHLLLFDKADSLRNFHMSRIDKSTLPDTIVNPFDIDTSTFIKTDAQNVFFSYSKNNTFKTGNCIAFTNFRKARVENGTELIYDSKSYIKSNTISSVSYSLIGKYKYSGYIESATDSIDFYLPDMDTNYAMAASGDGITYLYNDSLHVITIFATKNNVEFIIHLLDPCLVSCYFPSTYNKITNTFNFNSGNTEVLGHKLEIKQPMGNLKITNSSKMIISCDKYLYNKDSLILEGPCQSKAFKHKICNGIDALIAAYSDNSSITINTNCALVLELGSYTYVKNGGAIYVKQGGSLIVKAGAYLQIGDSGTCNQGWGEIIAEPGAYIHIEPGAQIIYRSTIGDTSDRNMFIIPTASGMPPAYHGVGYFIKTLLYQDTILPLTFPTYPICGLDTTNPIINKPWGYTNFAKPLATFQVKNDTICPEEPLHIKLNRILNDAKTAIEVCRIDSFKVYYRDLDSSLFRWQDTCIIDTLIKDSILPDPVCKEPRTAPDDLTFWFKAGTTHRVTIRVWNDCGIMDDTLSYIHVLDSPKAIISVPDIACEGRGTVTANLSKRNDLPITYKIEIIEKQDTIDFYKPLNTYKKTYYGVLPSSINFNDFYFKGGKTYFVLLTLINECGSYTNYDSVKIPLSAKIILERPTVYSQQLDAATSVKLHGYTSSIDSFKWEPTTWLDSANSITPISTPYENITYVLSAYKNGCSATDTAYIKYNKYANAGHNDTLCYTSGQAVVLGNTFDYSIFLGWMCYYDTMAFNKRYNDKIIDNELNIEYFTAFMQHDLFKRYLENNSSFKAQYDNFVTKHLILNQNWYLEYLNMLYDNSISKTAAFNYFVDRINEGESTVIRDNLDSIADALIIVSNLNALFDKFKTFNDDYLTDIQIYWNGITNYEEKFSLRDIGNKQLIYQLPTQTQKYTLTLIAYNTTEIDEITVMVDTVLTPLFYTTMQFDSTVYFMNNTEPISSATTYEWNFGDGSSNSNELNPIHTFPAFDSNYVVCLTASNKCNSWQYCDTVWVDSLHLGGALKIANKPAFFEINQKHPDKINVRSALGIKPEARSQQLVALQNYPNPFNQSTIIDYQIWQSFNQAELRITNILGQVLFSQKLQKPIDKVEIDGSNLANGLYYYSIVVDNSVKLTKTMSVMH